MQKTKEKPISISTTQRELFEKITSIAPTYIHGPYLQNMLKGIKNQHEPIALHLLSPQTLSQDLLAIIDKKLPPQKKMLTSDKFHSFFYDGLNFLWFFIPDYDPEQERTKPGITIDQVFLNLSTFSLLDPTNQGLDDIYHDPIVIRTSIPDNKWDNNVLANILIKKAFFKHSEVASGDLEIIKNIENASLPDISIILWLPYPCNTIRFIIENIQKGQNMLFDSFLRVAPNLGVVVPETITPKQVFSSKNLKLLDTYTDYFENQKVTLKNNRREKTLLKILLHGDNI